MTQNHDPATPDEKRALSRDELELADLSRNPALSQLTGRDLSDLVTRLRERRNRARDIGDRQGREARGKAEPAGTAPARSNVGTQTKHDYLSAALERAMAERDRRGGGEADDGPAQTELSQAALDARQAGDNGANPMMEDGAALHPRDPDADKGKKGLAETERDTAPSGALDHSGELPARERSGHRG